MKSKILAVALALGIFAALATNAHALTLTNGFTGQPMGPTWQRWLSESRAPLPTGNVKVYLTNHVSPCGPASEWYGCTDPTTLDIYVNPNEIYGRAEWRQTLYHELGHVLDFQQSTDRDHMIFKNVWGLDALGWWQTFGTQGESPGEWFAESYRYCSDYGDAQNPHSPLFGSIPHYNVYQFFGYSHMGQVRTACWFIKHDYS